MWQGSTDARARAIPHAASIRVALLRTNTKWVPQKPAHTKHGSQRKTESQATPNKHRSLLAGKHQCRSTNLVYIAEIQSRAATSASSTRSRMTCSPAKNPPPCKKWSRTSANRTHVHGVYGGVMPMPAKEHCGGRAEKAWTHLCTLSATNGMHGANGIADTIPKRQTEMQSRFWKPRGGWTWGMATGRELKKKTQN